MTTPRFSLYRACPLLSLLSGCAPASLDSASFDGHPVDGKAYACSGGEPLWFDGESAGCSFEAWDSAAEQSCGDAALLSPAGDGSCYVCALAPLDEAIEDGDWGGFTLGATAESAAPADFSCLACAAPAPDLRAWWSFDDVAVGWAEDLSGNLSDGNLRGPLAADGAVQGGLRFDGVDDRVQVFDGGALDPGALDLSVDFWIRYDDAAQRVGERAILDKRTRALTRGLYVYTTDGRPALRLADGSGARGFTNFVAPSSARIPIDGAWHHVAITVDRDASSGLRFYLDGASMGTANPTAHQGTLASFNTLWIGMRSDLSRSTAFAGRLDEVQLFSRALSAGEVATQHDAAYFGQCKG